MLIIRSLWLLAWPLALGAAEVVVVTPHVDAIRYEFARAFRAWHQQTFGADARVEWRDAGGTSDSLRFVLSEFSRKPAGIGIDCFFGGGQEPYLVLTEKRLTHPYKPPGVGLEGIPQRHNGTEIYDSDGNWYAAALSSFGILQNLALQRRLKLPQVTTWRGLADPRLMGWVGAGDPRNSGTMNVMFETFLQYFGWERGWQVLTQISGNVRKFDRISSATAKDVTVGETVYAFAIDFYGFAQVASAGKTNLAFALPTDFAAINPDGICLLKGGPNPTVAEHFLQFVLSEAGQKLWLLPKGHNDGPKRHSIERMPVRPDLYRRYKAESNIQFSPFDLEPRFRYDPELSRKRREVVAALAGALLVDTHDELVVAWKKIVADGMKNTPVAQFGAVPVTAAECLRLASTEWKTPAARNRRKIEWQNWARDKYQFFVEPQESPE